MAGLYFYIPESKIGYASATLPFCIWSNNPHPALIIPEGGSQWERGLVPKKSRHNRGEGETTTTLHPHSRFWFAHLPAKDV